MMSDRHPSLASVSSRGVMGTSVNLNMTNSLSNNGNLQSMSSEMTLTGDSSIIPPPKDFGTMGPRNRPGTPTTNRLHPRQIPMISSSPMHSIVRQHSTHFDSQKEPSNFHIDTYHPQPQPPPPRISSVGLSFDPCTERVTSVGHGSASVRLPRPIYRGSDSESESDDGGKLRGRQRRRVQADREAPTTISTHCQSRLAECESGGLLKRYKATGRSLSGDEAFIEAGLGTGTARKQINGPGPIPSSLRTDFPVSVSMTQHLEPSGVEIMNAPLSLPKSSCLEQATGV
ncbi:unnamed protein product [Protopolystoma xenopodis]|uniref:Uncharacterized protein n=1 Tax=Protopolystoma xenopodis TaxID=117903 RepID=A0A448X6P4_9PLAT|nr:unnamed protein product [Protopolystoma xenopodis]